MDKTLNNRLGKRLDGKLFERFSEKFDGTVVAFEVGWDIPQNMKKIVNCSSHQIPYSHNYKLVSLRLFFINEIRMHFSSFSNKVQTGLNLLKWIFHGRCKLWKNMLWGTGLTFPLQAIVCCLQGSFLKSQKNFMAFKKNFLFSYILMKMGHKDYIIQNQVLLFVGSQEQNDDLYFSERSEARG
jgi:hypothetical protein